VLAVLDALLGVEPDAEGEVLAGGAADRRDHLGGEAHPALERAAVRVAAAFLAERNDERV